MILFGRNPLRVHFGELGILPSQIPDLAEFDSPLADDLDPGDANTLLLWLILNLPATGTLVVLDDGTYQHLNPGPASSVGYRLFAVPEVGAPVVSEATITSGVAAVAQVEVLAADVVVDVVREVVEVDSSAPAAPPPPPTPTLIIGGPATVGSVLMLGAILGAVAPSLTITGQARIAPVQMRGSLSGYLSTPEPLSGPAYASALAYIERFGIDEAVGMLGDEEHLLTATLLRDAIAGVFSGTPSAAQVQAAKASAARLRRQLASTSNFMNGYLRSAVVLPMASGDANAGTLEECCLHLARFGLADDTDNATERMDTVAKMWRDWLRDVSIGKVQLVGVSGNAAPSQGRVRTGRTKSRWDWSGYGNGGGNGGFQ